jgi:hypothetical protein
VVEKRTTAMAVAAAAAEAIVDIRKKREKSTLSPLLVSQ